MIACEYIGCNIGEFFHLKVVALMHGTFKSNIDKFLCERWMSETIFDKCFHIDFDFGMDTFYL